MAKLDQIFVCNPTDTDFEVRYDGEKYTLKVGEETIHNQYLARHMAKHLSDRMLIKDFYKVQAAFVKKHKSLTPHQVDQQLGTEKTRLTMQDSPERRIALYKILRSTEEVNNVIEGYPQFKTRKRKDGSIEYATVGNIDLYNEFVEKAERTPEEKVSEEKTIETVEEAPVRRRPGRPRKTPQV